MSDNVIITNDLTKRYGDKKAVDRINIHVNKGEIYGLIGRNGAGKELASVRSKVGTLIENPGLYPNMSAYENI